MLALYVQKKGSEEILTLVALTIIFVRVQQSEHIGEIQELDVQVAMHHQLSDNKVDSCLEFLLLDYGTHQNQKRELDILLLKPLSVTRELFLQFFIRLNQAGKLQGGLILLLLQLNRLSLKILYAWFRGIVDLSLQFSI